MNVKYLCKKRILNKGLGGYVEVGNVVDVEFGEIRSVKIVKVNLVETTNFKITLKDLKEHFILYDDIETLDAPTAVKLFAVKFDDEAKESDILSDLKHYVKKRYNFIHQCNKADIPSGQNSTATLPTTSQQ